MSATTAKEAEEATKETVVVTEDEKKRTAVLEENLKTTWIDATHPIFRERLFFNLDTLERRFKKPEEFKERKRKVMKREDDIRLLANGFICALLRGTPSNRRDKAKLDSNTRRIAMELARVASEVPEFSEETGGCLDLSNGRAKLVGTVIFQCIAWTMLSNEIGGSDDEFRKWVRSTNPRGEKVEKKGSVVAAETKDGSGQGGDDTRQTIDSSEALMIMKLGTTIGDASSVEHRNAEHVEDELDARGVHVRPRADLKMLDLSMNGLEISSVFDANALKIFVAGVRRSPELRGINLNYNPLGPAAGRFLGSMLRDNRGLHTLCLRDARLGDDGVEAMIKGGLTGNLALRHLDLDMNNIGNLGATVISTALAKCKLRELRLCRNRIGVAGLRAIGVALKINPTLEALWLDENDVTDVAQHGEVSSTTPLTPPLRDTSGLQSVFAAAVSSRLRHVSLVGTVIGDEGIRAIAPFLIAANETIESVDLRSCGISSLSRSLIERLRSVCIRTELRLEKNAAVLTI
eukprot:g1582.t1